MTGAARPLIVGIGGTFRPSSTTERALRAALEAAEAAGARTVLLSGRDIDLPSYRPGAAERTPEARALVSRMRQADGLIVGSPGYHGGLSGMVKNALDYAEDLREDPRPYWDNLPVGCLVCAYGWQAATTTLISLRTVAHALRAWPTPLGVAINSLQPVFGEQGAVTDPAIAGQLRLLGGQVVDFALASGARRR